jgi:acetyl esterase/lipase
MAVLLEQRVMKGSRAEIPEAWNRASPIHRIDADAPPFFVIHGANDTLVPVLEARSFERALSEKSLQPCAYAELEGAQHAFELFLSLRSVRVNAVAARFLALTYSQYLDARTA